MTSCPDPLGRAFAAGLTASLAERGRPRADGVVRVKSAYPLEETVERLKKDIAAKGITFFDEIDQSTLAAKAGITLRPRPCWCSATRRSARSSSPPIRRPASTGRCACWCSRTRTARCGRCGPTSNGSPSATASTRATQVRDRHGRDASITSSVRRSSRHGPGPKAIARNAASARASGAATGRAPGRRARSCWCCRAAARSAPTRSACTRRCTRRGIEPDWVIGTSIGAINGALIAGNKPEHRLDAAARVLGRVEQHVGRRGVAGCGRAWAACPTTCTR